MSDAQHTDQEAHGADEVHEGPIKTPKQLIATVVAAFVVPVVVIIMLTNFVAFDNKAGAGSDAMSAESVARRIQPVGAIEIRDASDTGALKTGEQVFQAQCTACHTAGVAGAPKFGDAAAWAPRIKTGYDALLSSALKGKGNMTPQGGGDFGEVEVARAVVYMANKGGARFDEPKLPAAAASVATK
jgi:cytochrome c5